MFITKTANTKITVVSLEARSDAVFNALNAHHVFGNLEGTLLEAERRDFKNAVTEHALENNDYDYLELTYPSGVRLIISTTVFAGAAMFVNVTANAHPQKNERMDYESLNREIMSALNEMSIW